MTMIKQFSREAFALSVTAGFVSSIAIQYLSDGDFWYLPVGTVLLLSILGFGAATLGTVVLGLHTLCQE
jgi:hypothetical protein